MDPDGIRVKSGRIMQPQYLVDEFVKYFGASTKYNLNFDNPYFNGCVRMGDIREDSSREEIAVFMKWLHTNVKEYEIGRCPGKGLPYLEDGRSMQLLFPEPGEYRKKQDESLEDRGRRHFVWQIMKVTWGAGYDLSEEAINGAIGINIGWGRVDKIAPDYGARFEDPKQYEGALRELFGDLEMRRSEERVRRILIKRKPISDTDMIAYHGGPLNKIMLANNLRSEQLKIIQEVEKNPELKASYTSNTTYDDLPVFSKSDWLFYLSKILDQSIYQEMTRKDVNDFMRDFYRGVYHGNPWMMVSHCVKADEREMTQMKFLDEEDTIWLALRELMEVDREKVPDLDDRVKYVQEVKDHMRVLRERVEQSYNSDEIAAIELERATMMTEFKRYFDLKPTDNLDQVITWVRERLEDLDAKKMDTRMFLLPEVAAEMVRAEDDIDSPLSEMFRLFAAEYMEKGEVAEIKERLPELLDYVERTYKGIKQKTMKRARELVNQLGKGD